MNRITRESWNLIVTDIIDIVESNRDYGTDYFTNKEVILSITVSFELLMMKRKGGDYMRNTYWDRDYYSIYEVNGEKYIKFWGYFYDGCDDEEKPYRCLEFVGAEIPLEDYLKDRGISIEDGWSSYIGDMTEDEAIAAMNRYYNGNPPEPYPIQDVTMETPCGDYVDAIFYEKEESMTNKEAVENNYVAIFEAFDVNDLAWDIIIKVLRENIPGFNVGFGDGNYMAFAIPKNWEEVK